MKISKIIKKLKKSLTTPVVVSTLVIVGLISALLPQDLFASKTGYFVVTAYYSPLPNQEFYLTGDYNLEKRLNGQGIRGASGKPVFSGMLAAPKGYNFGTKIKLEGLGVGAVEDRGGAIVPAGVRGYSHDRIDVWVGYGDEGLKRALYWGKRKVKGSIVAKNTKTTLDYNNIASPEWATNGLKKTNTIFSKPIGKKSSVSDIKELQKFFSKINLYSGSIDGVYNQAIMDRVIRFQLDNKLIKSENDFGAGYWGALTRKTFLKKYLNGNFESKNKTTTNKKISKPVEVVVDPYEALLKNRLTDKVLKEKLGFFNHPVISLGEKKKLQTLLKQLGYYDGEINAQKEAIIDGVYAFQIANYVVVSQYDIGAGSYGPKTRKKMKQSYEVYLKDIENKRIESVLADKRKVELEEKMNEIKELSIQKAEKTIASIAGVKLGDTSSKVRILQKTLIQLGYLNTSDTAYFGIQTKQAIINLQIKNKLIQDNEHKAAGVVGPKTKQVLLKVLSDHYLEVLKSEIENKSASV